MNNLYYTTMYEGKLCARNLKMYNLKVKSIICCGYLGYTVWRVLYAVDIWAIQCQHALHEVSYWITQWLI